MQEKLIKTRKCLLSHLWHWELPAIFCMAYTEVYKNKHCDYYIVKAERKMEEDKRKEEYLRAYEKEGILESDGKEGASGVHGKRNAVGGYLTLEATCLMPIILFCLLFILYMGFWEYDKCLTEQDIFTAMLRGSNEKELSNEELNHELAVNTFAENKYLNLWNVQEKIAVSKDSISFEWNGSVKTILDGSQVFMEISTFALHGAYEVERYDPIGFIRNCRKVEHGIDRICK